MLVTCEEMRQLERAAFSHGIQAADLMEQAGRGIAEVVRQFFPQPCYCIAFCGKGNNAGDALVALRYLHEWGWQIGVDLAFKPIAFGELPRRHYDALSGKFSPFFPGTPIVALDGLLGLGAKGEPEGEIAKAIERLNALRQRRAAWVVAIDLPSGLDGDSGVPAGCCVEADLTTTIAFPKQGLVADQATNAVGRLALIPLPDLGKPAAGFWRLSTPDELSPWLIARAFDTHKGNCGRVGIVAGSHNLTGAARMASAAAVKAGAGLVTLYAKANIQPLLAATCIPEVMVKEVKRFRDILDEPMDVLAVGPGLGAEQGEEILSLVRDAAQPMVVDADALNAIAHDPALLGHCRGPRLLSPHPGEMQRLFPRGQRGRREWLEDFLQEYPVTLLLKGARTIIGAPQGERYYNTTGNPGMASGGMGDVLTGVCAALITQCGGDLLRSAVLGAWLCGRAAEISVSAQSGSPEFLSATGVIDHLGAAFRGLRAGY